MHRAEKHTLHVHFLLGAEQGTEVLYLGGERTLNVVRRGDIVLRRRDIRGECMARGTRRNTLD
jgi:hypothetical protein